MNIYQNPAAADVSQLHLNPEMSQSRLTSAATAHEIRRESFPRNLNSTPTMKTSHLRTLLTAALLLDALLQSTIAQTPRGVEFAHPYFAASEDVGMVAITILRGPSAVGTGAVELILDPSQPDNSATVGVDFVLPVGPIVFQPGEIEKTVTVSLRNDDLTEGFEAFRLRLRSDTPQILGTQLKAFVEIQDDERGIEFVGNYVGTEGQTPIRIEVTRGSTLDTEASVEIEVVFNQAASAATPGADFVLPQGPLIFAPGETLKVVEVELVDDDLFEGYESFLLRLVRAKGGSLGNRASIGVGLADDERGIEFERYGNLTDENAGSLVVRVVRGSNTNTTSTVSFSLTADFNPITATSGVDFLLPPSPLVFSPGETSKDLVITLVNDDLLEGLEYFEMRLTAVSGGSIGNQSHALISIVDDERGVEFDQQSYAVTEGEGMLGMRLLRGSGTNCTTTVVLTLSPFQIGSVATADVDYSLPLGPVVFQPGETEKTVNMTIVNDDLAEGLESVRLFLTSNSKGVLGNNYFAEVLIQSDDTGIEFRQSYHEVAENAGTLSVVLSRGTQTNGIATVELAINALEPRGNAVGGVDFLTPASPVVFQPGETQKVIAVTMLNNDVIDGDRQFHLDLTRVMGGALGESRRATVNIRDDERGIEFGQSAYAIGEPAGTFIVLIHRGTQTNGVTMVELAINASGSGNTSATPGLDFSVPTDPIVFQPGELEKSILVTILNDALLEGTESFSLDLVNPVAGSLGNVRGTVVFLYDDERGFFSSGPNTQFESASEFIVAIRREGNDLPPATVDYLVTAGRNPPAATPGVDFTSASGTLAFAANEQLQTIRIPILNDSLSEDFESLSLTLSNPTGGAAIEGEGTWDFGIEDNEAGYGIRGFVDSPDGESRITEREVEVQIMIVRHGDFDFASTVEYSVEAVDAVRLLPGATPGDDFEVTRGTLTFAPGQTSANLSVRLHADMVIEGEEHFQVRLMNPSAGVRLAGELAQFVILERHRQPARVDPDFVPEVPTDGPRSPSPWGPNSAPLPDGRVFVNTVLDRLTGEWGSRLLRLLADGSIDPAFAPSDVSQFVAHFAPTSDGGVILAGRDWEYGPGEFRWNGEVVRTLVRLKADGTRDTAFVLDPNVIVERVMALTVTSSGEIALAGYSPPDGSQKVFRLRNDGRSVASPVEFDGEVFKLLAQPDGGVLARGEFGAVNGRPQHRLTRLLPGGAPDPAFVSLPTDLLLKDVANLPAGRLVAWFDRHAPEVGTFVETVQGLKPNGEFDPEFIPYRVASPGSIQAVAADEAGIWVARQLENLPVRLVHLGTNGQMNPSQSTQVPEVILSRGESVGLSLTTPGGVAGGTQLFLEGAVLVNGRLRANLARLDVRAPVPRLEVAASSARIPENAGMTNIRLLRLGNPTTALIFRWATEDRTARAGTDYLAASGELTFAAGESEKTIALGVIDNIVLDEDRSLRIRIFSVPEGADLPAVEITLVNDDLGFLPGTFHVFPSGRWTVRATGHLVGSRLPAAEVYLERTTDLRDFEDWGWVSPYTDTILRSEGAFFRFRRD